MVDTTSKESLVNKTSHLIRKLITTMVVKSQQFFICSNPQGKVNKVKACGIFLDFLKHRGLGMILSITYTIQYGGIIKF